MKDTQFILEIIKELRADASLNYKKEVLARYSDYEPFKEFLIRVYSMKEAQAIADEYISNGGEGAIVKKLDIIWKDGTSKDMVKIKAVLDADLLCVDVEEGSGKYKGKVGALVLETSCGRLKVKVGTGLTDKDRDKPFDYYIGKVIEIQYNEFIKSKSKSTDSLFLPRFVEVREDKNTTTSYKEIAL